MKYILFALLLTYLMLNSLYASGYNERSRLLIDYIADEYTPPSMDIGDPEKYYWPKVIARFEKYGPEDALANQYIDTFRTRSPFHFTLVGMARIMSAYEEAPALEKHKKQYLTEVFKRMDSYNPWTGEGTENHISMSRTSGYLFAQHALNYPGEFPEAYLRLQQMKLWITTWASRLFEYGNSEWNSGIYQVYNMIGWFNLFDFADDPEVKAIARAVLDFYTAEIAIHYSWGTTGGTEMRGSGAGLSQHNATNYLGWLWFGTTPNFPFGLKGSQYIQNIHAITSKYQPPELLVQIGKKTINTPVSIKSSRPSYNQENPSFVKQHFYVTNNYSLGSCVSPYGGWTGSTYQMINWRLVVRGKTPGLPHEIGGNGRYYDEWSGKTTNPFTQVVQHNNVLIQMTKTPANADEIISTVKKQVDAWAKNWKTDFTERFPFDTHKANHNIVNFGGKRLVENSSYITLPPESKVDINDSCYIISVHNALIVAIPFNSVRPLQNRKNKHQERIILMDKAPFDSICGFILEIIHKDSLSRNEQKSLAFANKKTNIKKSTGNISYTTYNGEKLEAQYGSTGTFKEATVDWGYGITKPAIFLSHPDFHQPDWPAGEGYGRVPEFKVNGKTIDYQEKWPIIDGENVKLENKVLKISAENQTYTVDFTKKIPSFE